MAILATVTVSCGSISPSTPVGPSAASSLPSSSSPSPDPAPAPAQQFPSLAGEYRTSGMSVEYRNRENGAVHRFSCTGGASVTSQAEGGFSGRINTSGNGYNSDRFCGSSASFSGVMTADGTITRATIDPRFGAYRCEEFVSGDGVYTGNATATTFRMQTADRWRCPVNLDGGLPGNPTAEFDRTVTLSFERR